MACGEHAICSANGVARERRFCVMIGDVAATRILGALALALVAGALGFQYLVHLAPCEMCHWQRWPLIAAAIIGLGSAWTGRGHVHLRIAVTILAVAIIGLAVTGQWRVAPYIGAAALVLAALLALAPPRRAVLYAVIALVAASGLTGLYQTGMQYHILPGPSACTAGRYVLGSGAPPPEVSCDVPTWFLFGLALPAYNAIFSLGAALAALLFTVKKTRS